MEMNYVFCEVLTECLMLFRLILSFRVLRKITVMGASCVMFIHNFVCVNIDCNRSDSSVEVWNLAHTPHIERTIPGRANSSVEAVVWCGQRLFSAGLQGTVTEYNLHTLSNKVMLPFFLTIV
jgi:hypothetical protein